MSLNINKISAMTLCVALIGALLFAKPVSFADQLDSVWIDFAVVNGYVVQQIDDEYIIDLDEANNIRVDDLFAVLEKGEPIVHPVSKKVIGSIEKVKSILKVTRIKEGYSYARPLFNTAELKPGDPIKRYSGLKVKFWDHTENGRPLWKHLRRMLPDLKWEAYLKVDREPDLEDREFASASTALHFILTDNHLRVYDAGLDLLRQYALTKVKAESNNSDIFHAPPIYPSNQKNPGFVNSDNQSNYFAASLIGEYQGATTMADLVSFNDRLLLASTDGWDIDVYEMSSGIQMITAGIKSKSSADRVLALKWWYPSTDGPLHLVAVMWSDDRPVSNIFIFENNNILPVVSDQKSILGTFDFDKDGRPETLLSQQFDPDEFFGSRIRQMNWNGRSLKAVKLKLDLPRGFTVIGSLFADLTNDGNLETIYVRRGVLKIYSGLKGLYTSPKKIGGTLSALTYEKDTSFKDYQSTTAYFEVTPIVVDIDRDGKEELLAVSTDRPAVSVPGISLKIDNSRLASIHRTKNLFSIKHQSPVLGMPVQGIWKIGNRIIYLLTEQHEGSDDSGLTRTYEIVRRH